MNYEDEEENKKQIDKLERLGQIYADSEKHESVMSELEEEEDICAFPRKIFKWIMIITWAACVVGLFGGIDMSLALCGMLLSLGIFCGLCVTKFLQKKKISDAVISALVCAGCIMFAVLLLIKG